MSLSSDEVNFLVYRYLLEAGFTHAAFVFGCESHVSKVHFKGKDVPVGALVTFIQKGFQYMEIEANLNEEGTDVYGEYTPLRARDILTKDLEELRLTIKEMQERGLGGPAAAAALEAETAAEGAAAAPAAPAGGGEAEEGGEGGGGGGAAAGGAGGGGGPAAMEEEQEAEPDFLAGGPLELPPASLRQLEGHGEEVYAVCWCPTANLLATTSGDSTARIWDLEDVAAAAAASGAAGGAGGGAAAVNGGGGSGAPGGVRVRVCKHAGLRSGEGGGKGDVTSLDWAPDGQVLATGAFDGGLRLWNRDGSLRSVMEGHTGPLFCLKYNRKGDLLLTGGVDKAVVVWDLKTGGERQRLSHHSGPVLDVAWRNNSMFATSSQDRTIVVCRVGDARPSKVWQAHSDEINCIQWGPGGRLLASCSDDGTIKIWHYAADRAHGGDKPLHTLKGHSKEVNTVRWGVPESEAAGGRALLASGSFDHTVKIWDAESGACLQTLQQHQANIYSISWSPSGNYLATGSYDGQVYIWAMHTGGTLARSFKGSGGGIYELAWNAEGDLLAACFQNKQLLVAELRRAAAA